MRLGVEAAPGSQRLERLRRKLPFVRSAHWQLPPACEGPEDRVQKQRNNSSPSYAPGRWFPVIRSPGGGKLGPVSGAVSPSGDPSAMRHSGRPPPLRSSGLLALCMSKGSPLCALLLAIPSARLQGSPEAGCRRVRSTVGAGLGHLWNARAGAPRTAPGWELQRLASSSSSGPYGSQKRAAQFTVPSSAECRSHLRDLSPVTAGMKWHLLRFCYSEPEPCPV